MATDALLRAFLPQEDELLAQDPLYGAGSAILGMRMPVAQSNWEAFLTPIAQGLAGGALQGFGRDRVEEKMKPAYSSILEAFTDAPYEYAGADKAKSDLMAAMLGYEQRQDKLQGFAELQDFVQKELIKNQIINTSNEPKRLGDLEKTTYDRITGLPIAKQFSDIEANFNTLQALSGEDSKPAAVGMISALARIWDPAATVREGEYKINSEAQSVLDQIVGDWKSAISGKNPLSPETRQRMISAAAQKYNQFGQQYSGDRKLLIDALSAQGGNPANVPTRDFKPFEGKGIFAGQQQSSGGSNIPPGMKLERHRKTGKTRLVPQ